jgi:hypothetical protein
VIDNFPRLRIAPRSCVIWDIRISTRQNMPIFYCNFAYSALACFRMGMSGSASFQRVHACDDLFLAQKIEVGVAAGTSIDDGGKVAGEIIGVAIDTLEGDLKRDLH